MARRPFGDVEPFDLGLFDPLVALRPLPPPLLLAVRTVSPPSDATDRVLLSPSLGLLLRRLAWVFRPRLGLAAGLESASLVVVAAVMVVVLVVAAVDSEPLLVPPVALSSSFI